MEWQQFNNLTLIYDTYSAAQANEVDGGKSTADSTCLPSPLAFFAIDFCNCAADKTIYPQRMSPSSVDFDCRWSNKLRLLGS